MIDHVMPTSGGFRFLWGYALLFVLLGGAYAALTPIFENSDETLHYPYVKHLADGQGLPLAEPGRLWNQEGTQPPLYYALAALTTFWIDTDNLSEHLQYNPHWLFTEVRLLLNDNQNRVLHGPMDAFPYRRAALAIHLSRWLSLSFGLITVVCTFLIARLLFDSLSLAVTTTALTALTPQFIRVSATVSNDSLSAAIAALTVLAALTFTAPNQRFGTRHALLLGLLSGLALLTKLSSLTSLLLAGYIIVWRLLWANEVVGFDRLSQRRQVRPTSPELAEGDRLSQRRQVQPTSPELAEGDRLNQRRLSLSKATSTWREHYKNSAFTLFSGWKQLAGWLLLIGGVTLAMSGWWFVRNYNLYGEWLATETHLNLAGRGYLSLPEIWQLRSEIERAYWATFGWGQIRPPEWVFQALGWFTRLGLLGLGLLIAGKLFQRRQINLGKIIFLLFWVALNLALYLRWVTEVGSVSHTRLIFPAITAISLLLALGWHSWMPARLEPAFAALVTAGLLALNLYSLGWLIDPAFSPPERPLTAEAAPIDLTFLEQLRLAEAQVSPAVPPGEFDPRKGLRTGDAFSVQAAWQVLAPPDKNYSVSLVLLAPDGAVLARRETYPGLGLRPTRYLTPGQSFVDTYPLTLSADVAEPMVARVALTLFDRESAERTGLPAIDPAGNEVTPIVGQLKIVPIVWPEVAPQQPVQVDFGGAIALLGYDLHQPPPGSDDPARLTLYWQALRPVEQDYNLFIHLLDGEGQRIGQADAAVTGNVYPTRWWASGETIIDRHKLPLTPDVVRLRLGLYSLSDGQRLPVSNSSLPVRDNSVTLVLP